MQKTVFAASICCLIFASPVDASSGELQRLQNKLQRMQKCTDIEKKASQAGEAGDKELQLKLLNQAVSVCPSQGLFSRATYYRFQNDYDAAIRDYSAVIELKNKNRDDIGLSYAYRTRGKAYELKNDFQNALNDFNKAIEIARDGSDKIESLKCRAKLFAANSLESKALSDFDTIIAIDPENGLLDKADFLASQGKADQSIECLAFVRENLKDSPNKLDTMRRIANVLLKVGPLDEYLKAITDYIQLETNPGLITAFLRQKAFILTKTGSYDQALKLWNDIAKQDSESKSDLLAKAECLLKTGHDADAKDILANLTNDQTKDKNIDWYKACACELLGDYSTALELLSKVKLSSNQESVGLYDFTEANLLMKLGKKQQALDLYRRIQRSKSSEHLNFIERKTMSDALSAS